MKRSIAFYKGPTLRITRGHKPSRASGWLHNLADPLHLLNHLPKLEIDQNALFEILPP
jgi:hypothetical protein